MGRTLKLHICFSSGYRRGLLPTSCYQWSGAADGVGGFYADQHWYTGGFDFALVPRAVSEEGVAGHIRVGFVHHWSGMSKEEYAAALGAEVLLHSMLRMLHSCDLHSDHRLGSHVCHIAVSTGSDLGRATCWKLITVAIVGSRPHSFRVASPKGPPMRMTHLLTVQVCSTGGVNEDWLQGSHPRAILGLLAARCEQEVEAPVDVVVTDGAVFDLLRCDGSDVLVYRGLDEWEVGDVADTSVTVSPDLLCHSRGAFLDVVVHCLLRGWITRGSSAEV